MTSDQKGHRLRFGAVTLLLLTVVVGLIAMLRLQPKPSFNGATLC